MRVALALAAVVVSSAGCEKSKSKIPDDPQPRPAALIATVALPSASALLPFRDLVAAANTSAAMAVDPTIVMMTATSGVGAPSLEVLDPAAPLYGLWLDDGKVRGLAIVGKIKDSGDDAARAKLKPAESIDKNGWIVIASSKEIVEMAAPYALTTVVATPPSHPSGTIYVPNLVARYSDKIVAWRNTAIRRMSRGSPLSAASAAGYVDGVINAIRQTDEIRIGLEPNRDGAALDVTIAPRAKSALAEFVGAQKPSDFSIGGKLPDKIGSTVVAGRIVLGPYQAGVISWIAGLYGVAFGNNLVASYTAILKAMTGELAVTADYDGGLKLYFLAGLADPAAVDTAIAAVQAVFKTNVTLDSPQGKVTYKAAPDVTVDGVTLHVDDTITETKVDPKKPDVVTSTRHAVVGVFDNLMMVAGTFDAIGDAAKGIATARGKAPGFAPPAELAAEIAAAKTRHDSLVGAFAIGRSAATGSVGFSDSSIHLRVTVPTTVVRSLHP